MIPRTLEPELMDGEPQAAAYAGADFAAPNQSFVDRFLAQIGDLATGSVVDLGCGPADIAIRLCRARPGLRVVAIDGAPAMLAHARAAVAAAALEDRITLVQATVPGALPAGRRFDAVISNSLLHHLPDPAVLWREVIALASPGAFVLVVDLARPESDRRARELVDQYAAGEPAVLRQDFYHSLRAAFTVDEVAAQLAAQRLADRLTVTPTSDRHLAVHGRL